MKILFVHEVSWFNKVVYEMHDVPELLSLRGHNVFFLDFDEGAPRARWKPVTTVESRAHNGSRVTVTTPPRFLPGILGRLLATIIQPVLFLRLMLKIRPDVVVSYSIPTSGWQIARMCKLLRTPIVARVIDVPHTLRQTVFKPLVRWAERYVFRTVDHVSTHNVALLRYCVHNGARFNQSSVIFPGIDFTRFRPDQPDFVLLNRFGIQSTDKVLLYMGTLFRFSGLFELLSELAPILNNRPEIKFLILGNGEDADRLEQLVQNLGLRGQVIMPGRIEYDELANHIQLGTVGLLPFRKELVTHCALPAKVFQYLACGLPTISTQLEGLTSSVDEGLGVTYAADLEEMSLKALRLIDEPEELRHLAQRGISTVHELCTWDRQLQMFESVLEDVISRR